MSIRSSLQILALVVLTGVSGSVLANQCQVSAFSDLQKVGETRLKVWFWDVYDAQLRTDTGQFEGASQRALQLSYLRDIKAQDLVETTAEEWERMGIVLSEQHRSWLEQLQSMWPNVTKGDCITLVETSQGYAEFYGPEGLLGEIPAKQFTDDFLAIWLAEESRFKTERNELIGAQ